MVDIHSDSYIALEQRKHRLSEIKKLQKAMWDLRDELDYECRREGFDWDLMNSRLRTREVPLERLVSL